MTYSRTVLKVSNEYCGFIDYWGGNGRRWDDDAGCLFAYYCAGTTLKDCVDSWCDDFWAGGDCDTLPANISQADLREAILNSLTRQGLDDYYSGALAECAIEYAEVNGYDKCLSCDVPIGDEHTDDCADCGVVTAEDCEEQDESPMWVILVEVEEYSILDDFDGWFARKVDEIF